MPPVTLPKHVAIIPDGNRRWAKAKGLPTLVGHRKGFERVIEITRHARRLGIHTLTLWGFSTENWNREQKEKKYLFSLFSNEIDQYLEEAKMEKVRVVHLGRKDRLPEPLVAKIRSAEQETARNHRHVLNLALDYGGQDEILRAVKKYGDDIVAQKIPPDESLLKNYLDTAGQPYPYPDLIIRTSGEYRLSGYLLWQSAYSELYFEKSYFPDFTPGKFDLAIEEYSRRQRRFGGN